LGTDLKITIYEYVSGGGYAGQPIPLGVLAEGYAMLRTVAADFKAAGHEVTVLLDSRVSKLNPPLEADFTIPISYAGEPERFISNISHIQDAFYIIAPETSQTLCKLVQNVEATRKISLNSTSSAIAEASDKTVFQEKLQKKDFTLGWVFIQLDCCYLLLF